MIKRVTLSLLFSLLLPVTVFAAGPVLDNKANGVNTNPVSTSYTVGTGANRFLALFINADGGNLTVTSAPTYNGVAMIQSKAVTGNTNWGAAYSYYLVAPATGANTLAFQMSGSGFSYTIYSFTNALQTQAGMASASINSGAGGQTMTLTTLANNSIGIGQLSGSSQGGTGFVNDVITQNAGDQKAGYSNVSSVSTGITFTSGSQAEGTAMEIGEAPAAPSIATSLLGIVRAIWMF